jgi:XRE family transcriptional regulator, aerobic/anaerobic benzoate catabolism transcriptional regulator
MRRMANHDGNGGGQRDALLRRLGARVREFRLGAGLAVRDFADRADLSPRFVNQLEAGTGNISVAGLARVAQALSRTLPELLPPADDDFSARAQVWRLLAECDEADVLALERWLAKRRGGQGTPRFIALVGPRGVGKSTLGPALAGRLKRKFVELDRWVEVAAGMTLGDIFTVHGEGYYRRLEREALARLFSTPPTAAGCVFAPGGSVVTDAESWETIKRRCFTVWLHAAPEEIVRRVRRQGDIRSIQGRPALMDEMKALLARREPLYAESHLALKTTGRAPEKLVAEIMQAITA